MMHTKVSLVDYEVSEHGEVVSGEGADKLISSRRRCGEFHLSRFPRANQYRVGDHP